VKLRWACSGTRSIGVGRCGLEPRTSAVTGAQRSTNEFGRPVEMSGVIGPEGTPLEEGLSRFADLGNQKNTIEPMLRRSATLEVDTSVPIDQVLEVILELIRK
jgi:hypothetical protein